MPPTYLYTLYFADAGGGGGASRHRMNECPGGLKQGRQRLLGDCRGTGWG